MLMYIQLLQIQDTSSSPTLSRLLASGVNKTGSINSARIPEETMGSSVDNLCQEMNDLMHDYEVVSRILTLVSSLRGTYDVSIIFPSTLYVILEHSVTLESSALCHCLCTILQFNILSA